VRHDDVCAVAAGAPSAERARVEAKQFLALPAHCAFSATDPWVRSSSRINPSFYHHLTGFVASICYKGFQWVVPG